MTVDGHMGFVPPFFDPVQSIYLSSSSDQVHDAGLKETVNASLKQLKDMIRDLRRQIRNAVTGPSETSNPLEVDDKRHVVISGFTVRHLLNGNQFGARPA